MKYILALDSGTTSSRAMLLDRSGLNVAFAQKEVQQLYPEKNFIECTPNEIYGVMEGLIREVVSQAEVSANEIGGIGITNQRETVIVWDRKTGTPIWNAISWQDTRTIEMCKEFKRQGHEEMIRSKTGLPVVTYFSATKVCWILDHVEGAREKAEKGELCLGTVDSWLIWNLTGKKVHATDASNASRTMLYNIFEEKWDDELLELFNIPRSMLPEVKSSSEEFGQATLSFLENPVPITGVIGDQQAALFGLACVNKDDMMCSYGTGAFILGNREDDTTLSPPTLSTTIAWKRDDRITYAYEGCVLNTGSAVTWMRDSVGLIHTSQEIELLAKCVPDSGGVYFVPAFSGLGAPYWKFQARATVLGMSRSTNIGHISRAIHESIAHRVTDVVELFRESKRQNFKHIRVAGGACENNLLMQLQSDMLNMKITRLNQKEVSSYGAAFMAGLAVGFWKSEEEVFSLLEETRTFEPQPTDMDLEQMRKNWKQAVNLCLEWEKINGS
ncbi:MAG: Glycerol kinase [Chlamydiia bacterium]|nr:Glycerol kinase [Chlamydiia bacterium]